MQRLKETIKHPLVKNFSSLVLIQGMNYLFPLITFVYITHVFGKELFGRLVFAMAIVSILMVLSDFGFNLSGPKNISVFRNHKQRRDEIFNGILLLKGSLSVFLLLAFIPFVIYIDKLQEDYLLYIYILGYVIGNALIPKWFFQGVEKMQYLTLFVFISKLLFTIGVFTLIREKEDYYLYPLVLSIPELSVAIISIYLAVKRFDIQIFIPKKIKLLYLLRESSTFFYSSVAISLFGYLNTVIIGDIKGNASLGLYAIAERCYNFALTLLSPVKDVLYPYMAKKRNIKLYKKLFIGIVFVTIIGAFILYYFSELAISLVFDDAYIPAAKYLSFFGFILLFQVPSMMLGYPLLGAVGRAKDANKSVIYATLLYVVAVVILYKQIEIETILVMLLLFQIFVLTYRSVATYKYFRGK